MRKTDKKYDNAIREALTEVCELTMKHVDGFEWLTHEVNYQRFPQSVMIRLMFTDRQRIADFKNSHEYNVALMAIQSRLSAAGITLKSIANHVQLNTA
ncbi:hypothetical protein BZG79_13900 [Salinivibrio sp. MA427]|uniref:hypothetical protein n=1 Tax=Salinivibrio TaxID=51366 RepID=UPI000395D37B|nr:MULTISPECIES: hypothetical protein [Salinivibrio]NUY55011.1 Fis family transcriptional regulator [Salinivibrio sp. EAGSL]OOE95560.1 hypothetical protein BZG75_02380 [Salinivibrio sp. AR640]OOF03202.1 hypothetical protein BZG80_10590 [Salinivibrio sp. MA440]OOF05171.1 hypothetical protein BZG79_13900 [Salinivibrio sp. MA427]